MYMLNELLQSPLHGFSALSFVPLRSTVNTSYTMIFQNENIFLGICLKHLKDFTLYEKFQLFFHNLRTYASTSLSVFIGNHLPQMLRAPRGTLNVSYLCTY